MTEDDIQSLQLSIIDLLQSKGPLTTPQVRWHVAQFTPYPSGYAVHALERLEARGAITSTQNADTTLWQTP